MAIPLDRKQTISFEELIMSQVPQPAYWKRIFTGEEFVGDGKDGGSGDESRKSGR